LGFIVIFNFANILTLLFPQVRSTTRSTIDEFYRQISYFYNVYSYISKN